MTTRVADAFVELYCPECHALVNNTVGEDGIFKTWDDAKRGVLTACLVCGLEFFAKPLLTRGDDHAGH